LFFNKQLISCAPEFAPYLALQNKPNGHRFAVAPAQSFRYLLSDLLRHPYRILRLWNWKSALLSTILRGPIFLVAAVRQGWKAAFAALLTESIFCAVSAGFYGAIVQSLKDAEPQWLTGIFLAGVVPVIFQVLEYLLHWFRGTPHLRIAEIVSLVLSGLSALFNWYAMRRGTLLVGGEGGTFGGDMRRLPRLIVGFLAALPRKIATKAMNGSSKCFDGSLG
jgi:hypothetical protein